MKEFNKTNKVTYNLMSFTGFKSLLLFSMLIDSPKTYEQICEYFENHEYIRERISQDTLRVYLTSLKRCGCEIERIKTPEGPVFSIVSHPFEFILSKAQIRSLIKIYKIIVTSLDIEDVVIYERFITKLANHIRSEDLLKAIKKVSLFKKISIELVDELIKYSKENKTIRILYNSPNSGDKIIRVKTNKVSYINDKLYLYGISLEYNQDAEYLISRIKEIVCVEKEEDEANTKKLNPITVGFEISTLTPNIKLKEDEKIVDIKDDSIIVEIQTTNLFNTKRRIMELGPLCTVLYPREFREEVKQTLLKMQKEYE